MKLLRVNITQRLFSGCFQSDLRLRTMCNPKMRSGWHILIWNKSDLMSFFQIKLAQDKIKLLFFRIQICQVVLILGLLNVCSPKAD